MCARGRGPHAVISTAAPSSSTHMFAHQQGIIIIHAHQQTHWKARGAGADLAQCSSWASSGSCSPLMHCQQSTLSGVDLPSL